MRSPALDSALRSVCAALGRALPNAARVCALFRARGTAQTLLERWGDDGRADLVRWVEVVSVTRFG